MLIRGMGISLACIALVACGKKDEGAGKAEPPPAPPTAAAPADAAANAQPPEKDPAEVAKARETYSQALARGRKLISDKKAAEAATAFKAALDARPGDTTALSELSWALFETGDHEAAIEAATASIAGAGKQPSLAAASLYNRGRAYEAHDSKDKAIADYQASYALRPHKVVRARLGALGAKVPESVWTATVLEGPFATVEDFCKTLKEGCQDHGSVGTHDYLAEHKVSWPTMLTAVTSSEWDDDADMMRDSLLFQTKDGWFALRNFDGTANRYGWALDRAVEVGGRLALHHTNERGRFATEHERLVTVCGVGASGRPSCFGPVLLADWYIGYEGSKEDGRNLPPVYGSKCSAQLVAGDRLEIKAEDAECRNRTAFAGEHKLVFP